MNLAVIGVGYVGLVTAAVFAELGNRVWALDIDKKKIEKLKKGQLTFYEPGLVDLVKDNFKTGRLKFTTSYPKALEKVKVVFICVGTPARRDGSYNLDYVFQAVQSVAKNLQDYALVVIKSTVPPGTNDEVEKIMKKVTVVPFETASCPEFLREGSAVEDSFHPFRIVIGVKSQRAKDLLLKLHQKIKAPRVVADIKSAQLIKYAANAFLATKISFINLISRLCDKTGADIKKVAQGLGLDPRIGDKFLQAGLGYGGSCFPKDTWALISFSKKQSVDFDFLAAVDKINRTQIDFFVTKVTKLVGNLKGKTVAVLGLAFKPHTDDMREARSILIIKKLQSLGAKIRAYDPRAMANARKILKKVKYCQDAYQAVKGADVLCLLTEWDEFRHLDFTKVKRLMRGRVIVDGRNIFPAAKLKKMGFIYEGMGQK